MMSTTTIATTEKNGRAVKQPTMEKAIEQLATLAKYYSCYAEAKGHTEGSPLFIYEGRRSIRVSFVDDVWFVDFGDVEVTSNGEKIIFPYRYTASDLTKTYKTHSKVLEELNAKLKSRTEKEIAEARKREIELLKEKLERLESGALGLKLSPFEEPPRGEPVHRNSINTRIEDGPF